MTTRANPDRLRTPSFTGRVIVDNWRGQLRTRSWPRKRGKTATPAQQEQRDWFALANQRAKYAAAPMIAAAIDAAKGTGWYPKDLILRAMSGGMWNIRMPDGQLIQPLRRGLMAVDFQGAIARPAGDIGIPTGSTFFIPWPSIVRDTAGFWDVGAPTRFTIPAGVQIVNIVAGMQQVTSGTGDVLLRVIRNSGTAVAFTRTDPKFQGGVQAVSGPLLVSAGDYFEANVRSEIATNLKGSGPTFFTLEVLDAL